MNVNLGPNDMIARFTPESMQAIKRGEVVFNNGARAAAGYFHPHQPEFIKPQPASTDAKNALIVLGIAAAGELVHKVVIPFVQKVVMEDIYPWVSEKIGEVRVKSGQKQEAAPSQDDVFKRSNVIDFEEAAKRHVG